jgi:hypothetical protein
MRMPFTADQLTDFPLSTGEVIREPTRPDAAARKRRLPYSTARRRISILWMPLRVVSGVFGRGSGSSRRWVAIETKRRHASSQMARHLT